MFGRTYFQDLIVMVDDDDCSFAPTFPSKVLGIKSRDGLFSCNSQTWAPMVPNMSALWFWGQINCLEGHYLNILFGRIMFEDLIVMADDDDFSFAPTFPSKVLGIKS